MNDTVAEFIIGNGFSPASLPTLANNIAAGGVVLTGIEYLTGRVIGGVWVAATPYLRFHAASLTDSDVAVLKFMVKAAIPGVTIVVA